MYLRTSNICAWSCKKKISAPGLAWQAALKSTKVKLDLLADFDSYEQGNKSASRNDKLDLAV